MACNALDSAKLSPVDRPPLREDAGLQLDGGPMGGDAGPSQRECQGAGELDTCTRANALTTCDGIDCLLVQCVDGFVDCDGETQNGCEGTLNSMENCGFCHAECALAHAQTSCEDGTCELIECQDAYGDCDEDPTNGCETDLNTLQDCGECGRTCEPVANGAPGCNDGQCGVGTCVPGYGDCDETGSNGCEEPLVEEHCGGCRMACEPPNALGDCESGSCLVDRCEGESLDCNGLPADGCEATLNTATHCGDCGMACELPNASALLCDASRGAGMEVCIIDHGCPAGATDCDEGAPENGCTTGYGDCNGLASDGCEAVLNSLVNCGKCGDACVIENAITSCEDYSCEQTGCEPGFGRCETGGPCVALANDEDNCGACGQACEDDETCYGGRCTTATCDTDRADCNGDGSCETLLTSIATCGLCGVSCDPEQASAECVAGRCAIDTCDPGFADCDGAEHNGCEVNIRTTDTCGACDTGCFIAGASASCSTGTCTFEACNPDRKNCDDDLSDGCEVNITLPTNCGQCELDCSALPNVLSGGCSESKACEIVCRPGYADCDQRIDNGCEASLDSTTSCNGCVDCTALPGVASATCGEQGCTDIVCEPNRGDCDGVASNGCEVDLRSSNHCGACNEPCALARASETCASGTCVITECDPGFANCDTEAANGCEASLGDSDTCGSCSNTCDDGWACVSGTCQCTEDAQCGSNEECCNGQCVNTNNVCSWWPCPVASTNRPTVNCDSCNSDCRLVGAQWCCAL
jgi:hypothetical protein